MQSHLPKVLTGCTDARPGGAAAWGTSVRSCGLACEQFVLLGPVQRQIEFGQPRRGELDGLPTLQDRLDQLRAQEGEANQTPNVTPSDALALGQLLERSSAPDGEFLKPTAPACDRFDQRRITSRAVRVLGKSGQHQLGFGSAPLENDCRRQPDSAATCVLRLG